MPAAQAGSRAFIRPAENVDDALAILAITDGSNFGINEFMKSGLFAVSARAAVSNSLERLLTMRTVLLELALSTEAITAGSRLPTNLVRKVGCEFVPCTITAGSSSAS